MRDESKKVSLKYFKPEFMSLLSRHPLWKSADSNPFEINKSVVVARLLSGRYRTDYLSRHWSRNNKSGYCLLCPGKDLLGTIEHMLVSCEALDSKRKELENYWIQKTTENAHLQHLTSSALSSSVTDLVQFLLDPSVIPTVIIGCQQNQFTIDEVLGLTRTYCYGIHRRRLQLIGRFKISK